MKKDIIAKKDSMKKDIVPRKWLMACLAVILLMAASPVLSQEADLDDEDMILFIADVSSQDPAPTPMATKGHEHGQAPSRPREEGTDSIAHSGHGQGGGIAAHLELTNDQITKMRSLHDRYYLETRNLRYDLMQRRLEMTRLFLDPKTDSASLLAKQREVSSVRQRLTDAMARMMVDWRAILTPRQIQKLDRAALAHGRSGHGMMGGGMMGGMGTGMMGGGCTCAMGGGAHGAMRMGSGTGDGK